MKSNVTEPTPQPDAYGFIHTLDGCTCAYGLDMSDITIQPPAGCRLGLTMGRKVMAAPDMFNALCDMANLTANLMEAAAAAKVPIDRASKLRLAKTLALIAKVRD